MDHAKHIDTTLVEVGIAAKAVPVNRLQVFLQAARLVQGCNLVDGAHQVGYLEFAEIERLRQHLPFFAVEFFTGVAAAQNQLQFVCRILCIVAVNAAQPCHAQDPVGAGVEHKDSRIHGPVEAIQGQGAPQPYHFGIAYRDGLGREFTDDDVQE